MRGPAMSTDTDQSTELLATYQWFEQYGYFGPDAEQKLAQTRAVYPEPLTSFTDWATTHMPDTEGENS